MSKIVVRTNVYPSLRAGICCIDIDLEDSRGEFVFRYCTHAPKEEADQEARRLAEAFRDCFHRGEHAALSVVRRAIGL